MRRTNRRKKVRFSPDCPLSLRRAFGRAGSYQALADERGVNVSYVYRALHDGICPSNPDIAQRLGFKDQRVRLGDERRKHIRWWKHVLSPQHRNQLIFMLWSNREEA